MNQLRGKKNVTIMKSKKETKISFDITKYCSSECVCVGGLMAYTIRLNDEAVRSSLER